jgi:hypothetical protein
MQDVPSDISTTQAKSRAEVIYNSLLELVQIINLG